MTHRRSCLNWAIAAIRENNDDTQAENRRDGTDTQLTPETAEIAASWIDAGDVDCMCSESDAFHTTWST